jgi:Na+/H+ antiporter
VNFIESSICLLFLAIISVPLAMRFRLPLEIFLAVGSCLVGFIPGVSIFEIDPVIVFELFLPPILFSAAYFISWRDIKFNLRPISFLAIGLVIFTTVCVAAVAKFILPGFSWAEGFLLGAIVSPSDASAATVLIKKVGAPRRLIKVLEGESLINDATALTLYRFALGTIMAGSFSVPHAIMQFFIIAGGGVLIGLITSVITIALLQFIRHVEAETTLTFITAFSSYIVAEHFGFSGVIATVVSGIYFSIYAPEFIATKTRINSKAVWGTVLFVINGFVFTLLGMQLPIVIKHLEADSLVGLIFHGIIISLLVIFLRLFWVFPMTYLPRLFFLTIARRDPAPSWQAVVALGWIGMRGIVSLAAVFSIPYQLHSGALFAHRDVMIITTYCVIIVTLIPPALTLPSLLRYFNLIETKQDIAEEAFARIRAKESVLDCMNLLIQQENIPQKIASEFEDHIQRKLRVIRTQLDDNPSSLLVDDYMALKKLTIAAIKIEKATLIKLRHLNEIHDEVFQRLILELDLEEARAHSLRI